MRDDALRIEGVSKQRGALAVLSDVSLVVRPGERVALLGHNGAGKSTLMRSFWASCGPPAAPLL